MGRTANVSAFGECCLLDCAIQICDQRVNVLTAASAGVPPVSLARVQDSPGETPAPLQRAETRTLIAAEHLAMMPTARRELLSGRDREVHHVLRGRSPGVFRRSVFRLRSSVLHDRIMMSIILNRWLAFNACGWPAGIRINSLARTRWCLPAMVISASPSSTCTNASNGAVCSLNPLPRVEGEQGDRAGLLLQHLATDDGVGLVIHEVGCAGNLRAQTSLRCG